MNEIDELKEILKQLNWFDRYCLLWKARYFYLSHNPASIPVIASVLGGFFIPLLALIRR